MTVAPIIVVFGGLLAFYGLCALLADILSFTFRDRSEVRVQYDRRHDQF